MELKVRVAYRNEEGEVVSRREYRLRDYVGMIRTDLFRIISDVESLYYRLNDGKPKKEWAKDDLFDFEAMKHRLQDKAGEVERIPSAIVYEGKEEDGMVTSTLLKELGI